MTEQLAYDPTRLRARADRLERQLISGARPLNERQQADVRMTIWSLRTSARLMEQLDAALVKAARLDGMALLPPTIAHLRGRAAAVPG